MSTDGETESNLRPAGGVQYHLLAERENFLNNCHISLTTITVWIWFHKENIVT